MEKIFEKYLEAKSCLYGMTNQFLTNYIRTGNNQFTEVCHHDFSSEGLLVWNYLNIDKDYISHEEMWSLESNLKDEKYNDKIDYREEYLKMCILLVDMTTKYYGTNMSLDDAKKIGVKFDEDSDEIDGEVSVCYHMHEGAGESVWTLLEIEDDIVGNSIFDNKRRYYCNTLMNKKRAKKLIR